MNKWNNQSICSFFKDLLQKLDDDNAELQQASQGLLSCLPDEQKDTFQVKLHAITQRWNEAKATLLAKCSQLENEVALSQQYQDNVQRVQDKAAEIEELVGRIKKNGSDDEDDMKHQYQVG